MKSLLQILVIIIAFPLTGFATGQAGDILIYKGDTLILFTNPLEEYLDSKTERIIGAYELTWNSTACYRGYQATWEITNDSLYLVELQKGCQSKKVEFLNLTKEFGTDKVFAKWYHGKIVAPCGNLLHYVHSGYESFYEKELVLTLEGGIQKHSIEYDNTKSYKSVFTENQDSLKNFIYSNINWNIVPDLKDESKKVFIIIESGKKAKPENINIIRGSDNESLNNEAIRVVNYLPEWDVYYRQGKVHRMKWTIPIIFNEENRKKYAR